VINFKNIFSLQKKIIYVLGGSGLIGKEIVNGASQFGAKIVIIDIEDTLKFKNKNLNSPKFVKRYLKKTPLNRMAKPKDIAAAAAIFLSSDASTYITGTNFLVDGGWSCI
jgi:NAD(P)-dependent dehydrogenase (short-subunit alcohol dehydrogenase family)